MSRTEARAAHLSASFIHGNNPLARLARPVARFLHIEAAGGLLLLAATVAALVWANSPWSASYESLWTTQVRVDRWIVRVRGRPPPRHQRRPDGAVLLRRRHGDQGRAGDRRPPRSAPALRFRLLAALGGMVVPALIYLAFNAGSDAARGWGIPMATDIAFASESWPSSDHACPRRSRCSSSPWPSSTTSGRSRRSPSSTPTTCGRRIWGRRRGSSCWWP